MLPGRAAELPNKHRAVTLLRVPIPRAAAGMPSALAGPQEDAEVLALAGMPRPAWLDSPGGAMLQGLWTTLQQSESKPPPPWAQHTLIF